MSKTLLINGVILLLLLGFMHHCSRYSNTSFEPCLSDTIRVLLPAPRDTFFIQGATRTVIKYLPDSSKTLIDREYSDSNLTVWVKDTFELGRPLPGQLSYQLKRPVPAYVILPRAETGKRSRWSLLAGAGITGGSVGPYPVTPYLSIAIREPSGHLTQISYDPLTKQVFAGRLWQIQFTKSKKR